MNNSKHFPKGPIENVEGQCINLRGNDIDTDRIIPARFLKCVSFENLGENVFADDRKEKKGLHPFDIKKNKNASILIVDKNFGCGSSREHAPQALMRWGIRAIIGNSFAEIFHGNCLSMGIPCIILSEEDLLSFQTESENNLQSICKISLDKKTIEFNKKEWNLFIEKGALEMLISGNWDATNTLISKMSKIKSVEENLPYFSFSKLN
ncbi:MULTISPECIES: 3-isopropylmalate dehydratase small subunit [Prochlorococcus]|uniref:3-isopropylmalate dehydratase small subunit n=1 Tax=Prochlorococcus TaxID=1218 RepID=UPI0005338903|nr:MULTISPECIES: 3-isopropylmalate dehydratase small subunit [Prochlorococcus]KGG13110.1 3-isopropylmalate dehydratase small subunit [Prochlorococcus sp. MIT 0601]